MSKEQCWLISYLLEDSPQIGDVEMLAPVDPCEMIREQSQVSIVQDGEVQQLR
jgi:hypothetical protein